MFASLQHTATRFGAEIGDSAEFALPDGDGISAQQILRMASWSDSTTGTGGTCIADRKRDLHVPRD